MVLIPFFSFLKLVNPFSFPDEDQHVPEDRHADAEGRDLQDGRGRPHRLPHRLHHLQHRLLGSLPPLKSFDGQFKKRQIIEREFANGKIIDGQFIK